MSLQHNCKFRVLILCTLLLWVLPALAEDDEDGFEGRVGVLYRSISVDGSERKFNEDFDGLSSGARLEQLSLNWTQFDSGVADYARVDLMGLGGEPYERTSIRVGRKGLYDLKLNQRKQDYLYNLFELVPDEDGDTWNTETRRTNLDLAVYARDNLTLHFSLDETDRSGESLFTKDFERELFLMETPVDRVTRRYSAGADFRIGDIDVVFRQAVRNYDNQFNNTTEGDLGLAPAEPTSLDFYEWIQNDSSSGDLTTLAVRAPLGDRVLLNVSYYGTLFGDEKLESRVRLNASGTDYRLTCSITGLPCENDGDCDAGTPGDVCTGPPNPVSITDGFSQADVESETDLVDVDLGVRIASPLSLHVGYRSLQQDAEGDLLQDLTGSGTPEAVSIKRDYSVDTLTGLLHYQPRKDLAFRFGYRTIDRELDRNGFDGQRDEDFNSNGDETLVIAVSWQANDWLRVSADHEDGDIDQALSRISPLEKRHSRGRLTLTPKEGMRIEFTYLDFENEKPTSAFAARSEGTTFAGSFWHKANEQWDYYLRYGTQELDTIAEVIFDGVGFGGPTATFAGTSQYSTENDFVDVQVNYRPSSPWRAYLRYSMAEADASNLATADDPSPPANVPSLLPIEQEYTDIELGAVYDFAAGVFVGASVRDFRYDDANDLLDYDGQSLTLRIGTTF